MNTKEKLIATEADMLAFGAALSRVVSPPCTIFLCGSLGTGKTTLVRGFLRGLQFKDKVKSPSYALVEPYEFPNQLIYHFDFYRIKDPRELEYIGIKDYFTPNAICLIEWPEKVSSLLPAPDLTCYLAIDANEARSLRLAVHSAAGENIVRLL